MTKNLLSYRALVDRLTETLGIRPPSKVSLWRWEKDGKFPKRVRPTPSTVAWVDDEVTSFIAELIAKAIAERGAPHTLPVPKPPKSAARIRERDGVEA